MVKKLITQAELARRAGVTPTAAMKATRSVLKDALVGKRIDAGHPATIKYINKTDDATTEQPATGIDSLYEAAIRLCAESNRYTVSNISRGLKIGQARAKRIFAMMQAAGTDKSITAPPPPLPKKKITPVVTGTAAARTAKKADALSKLNSDIEQDTNIVEIPEDITAFVHMTLYEIFQRFGTETAFIDWLKATKEIENINEKRLKNAATRGELVNRDVIKKGVIEPFDTVFTQLLTDGAKTIARRVVSMNGAGRSVEDCEKFVIDQISSFIKPAKAKINRTLKNV